MSYTPRKNMSMTESPKSYCCSMEPVELQDEELEETGAEKLISTPGEAAKGCWAEPSAKPSTYPKVLPWTISGAETRIGMTLDCLPSRGPF